jgi:hypothetical protein
MDGDDDNDKKPKTLASPAGDVLKDKAAAIRITITMSPEEVQWR